MIINSYNESYLYSVNRDLFKNVSAKAKIEDEFGKFLDLEEALIVFIGSDSCNIIHYLLSKDEALGSRYIFIEPDEVFDQVSNIVDLSTCSNRIWLIKPSQLSETLIEADVTSYLYIDGLYLRRSLGAEYGFYQQYRTLYWDIESQLSDLRWKTIVSLGQDAFVRRQLENCADNSFPISEIKNSLIGETVIVLAGGPSLDQHLNWVKKNRSKLVVFAVSRISARLQSVGLEPDFIFSVDPQEISYQISKEMLSFGPDVIFINQYHVVPQLLSQWPHRKFFMGNLLPWKSDLNPIDSLSGPGPTVTNSAIAAAAWLGSKRILLAGVDLCFTPEGYTHAQGSKERASGPKLDLSSLSVETNSGESANTISDYLAASQDISTQAIGFKEQGIQLINLSLHATKMNGVDYQSVEEINLKLTNFNKNSFTSSNCKKRLFALTQELQLKSKEVAKVIKLLRKATDLHQSMYVDGYIEPHVKVRLEKIDAQLINRYTEIFSLIKKLSIRALLKMTFSYQDLSDVSLDKVKDKIDIYYASLLSGAENLKVYIDNALDVTLLRLKEFELFDLSNKITMDITSKWLERNEAGRYKLYESILDDASLVQLRNKFNEETEKDYFTSLTAINKKRNVNAIVFRVRFFKDSNDLDGLQALRKSVEKDLDAPEYVPLIDATIYLLRRDYQKVIEVILPVTENVDSPILEHCLGIMVIACEELGYHQALLDAMAGLASINAEYLSLYADVLAANGQVSDAILHAIEYLEYFPNEKKVLEKINTWFLQLGISEASELVNIIDAISNEAQS